MRSGANAAASSADAPPGGEPPPATPHEAPASPSPQDWGEQWQAAAEAEEVLGLSSEEEQLAKPNQEPALQCRRPLLCPAGGASSSPCTPTDPRSPRGMEPSPAAASTAAARRRAGRGPSSRRSPRTTRTPSSRSGPRPRPRCLLGRGSCPSRPPRHRRSSHSVTARKCHRRAKPGGRPPPPGCGQEVPPFGQGKEGGLALLGAQGPQTNRRLLLGSPWPARPGLSLSTDDCASAARLPRRGALSGCRS